MLESWEEPSLQPMNCFAVHCLWYLAVYLRTFFPLAVALVRSTEGQNWCCTFMFLPPLDVHTTLSYKKEIFVTSKGGNLCLNFLPSCSETNHYSLLNRFPFRSEWGNEGIFLTTNQDRTDQIIIWSQKSVLSLTNNFYIWIRLLSQGSPL